MNKNKQIKQNILFHEKITEMQKTILDFDCDLKSHQDLEINIKKIYSCLENIKGMIYNEEIVYRGLN
tara:strand:+ start:1295 stop:1495 length:201 start_codon:yes stop_codon:yes gene_type:complete